MPFPTPIITPYILITCIFFLLPLFLHIWFCGFSAVTGFTKVQYLRRPDKIYLLLIICFPVFSCLYFFFLRTGPMTRLCLPYGLMTWYFRNRLCGARVDFVPHWLGFRQRWDQAYFKKSNICQEVLSYTTPTDGDESCRHVRMISTDVAQENHLKLVHFTACWYVSVCGVVRLWMFFPPPMKKRSTHQNDEVLKRFHAAICIWDLFHSVMKNVHEAGYPRMQM